MAMIKDNFQQQQQLQDKQTTEINDLKSLVLNLTKRLESNNVSNSSDPTNMPTGSQSSVIVVTFQSIRTKYFTPEILGSFFGEITTNTCKLIR
jgi:hypothetical protein